MNAAQNIPNGTRVAVWLLNGEWVRGCRVVSAMPGGYLIDTGTDEDADYYPVSRVATY